MRQASTNRGPALVTYTIPPGTRKYHRRNVVFRLIRELDSRDVEGRANPGLPLAYLNGNSLVVQVYPGVSSERAVGRMVRRAIPGASWFSTVPMSAAELALS